MWAAPRMYMSARGGNRGSWGNLDYTVGDEASSITPRGATIG